MDNFYKAFNDAVHQTVASLEATDRGGQVIEANIAFQELCRISRSIQDSGRKQYLVGNGASAAFANHMALDWTKNGGVPSHAFANSALITAMGNDLGYEEAFSAPLSWYAKSGDLLIAISSSGNSPNIIRTIETARNKGMGVVTISGLRPDNQARKLGDINLYTPAKSYGVVECAHQILLHAWLDMFIGVCEWAINDYQNMRRC
ncbi:SIS domain-containing protein [Cerasicoccus maritimus]|uniref:SIS domain-containing protein n=1 Tax=Cerasicoccus maritimus TaxID=490089 RepID=UPI0028528935|nr:SIS domain-containing protein [Cerasicoccus maritimus]